jgi:hypothetical protein
MMTIEHSQSGAIKPANRPEIVVSVLFKVPIIRAGVAATLHGSPGLLVLGTQCQDLHDLVDLLTATRT